MCNNYANDIAFDAYREAFAELKIPVRFPETAPNLEPRPEIRPTDVAPIIRASEDGPDWVQLPWGLAAARPKGPLVINLRSEQRRFPRGRCLVPASSFYEFTGTKYPKTKWRFSMPAEPWFCIAGLWRPVGDDAAFAMLTCAPGPDVAPYHNRQVVVLERSAWAAWLDLRSPAEDFLLPSRPGSLIVERVASGSDEREPALLV